MTNENVFYLNDTDSEEEETHRNLKEIKKIEVKFSNNNFDEKKEEKNKEIINY